MLPVSEAAATAAEATAAALAAEATAAEATAAALVDEKDPWGCATLQVAGLAIHFQTSSTGACA